jgi:hypothetical protein
MTTITTLYGTCIGTFKDILDIQKKNMNFGILSNAITGAGIGFVTGISYPVSFPAIIGYNLFIASNKGVAVMEDDLKKKETLLK